LFEQAVAYAVQNNVSTVTADPGSYYFLSQHAGTTAHAYLNNTAKPDYRLAEFRPLIRRQQSRGDRLRQLHRRDDAELHGGLPTVAIYAGDNHAGRLDQRQAYVPNDSRIAAAIRLQRESCAALDQVNLLVPHSPAGAGEVPILLAVIGQTSNVVTLRLK
jgi:hypothetical protein